MSVKPGTKPIKPAVVATATEPGPNKGSNMDASIPATNPAPASNTPDQEGARRTHSDIPHTHQPINVATTASGQPPPRNPTAVPATDP